MELKRGVDRARSSGSAEILGESTLTSSTKQKPILFSAPMIRAILEGKKSQTRRIVKPQPDTTHDGEPYWFVGGFRARQDPPCGNNPLPCPYGSVGTILWVKETYRLPLSSTINRRPLSALNALMLGIVRRGRGQI